MNSFELIPTEENLIHTLNKDLLKRNKDLVRFYDLLLAQEGTSSIAIDGRWGSGKTFFVKQSMLLINAKNPMSDMDDEKKASIVYAIPFPEKSEDVPENYNVAVYYDAWENDNDTDPVLSLVYEIIKQLGINYDFDDNGNIFKLAGSVLEAFTGRNINSIIENLKSENPLTNIREEKDLHEDIKNFFTELLVERGNRLVIFIDELDRCKPSYAVHLLERIKHYLCDERITFVFSVNLGELQHTIKHYYGNTFDACRYLDRFFDMRLSLPPADKTAFYREMGLDSGYILEKVSRKVIDTYNMELREATRFYRQVKTAAYEPTHDSRKWDFGFSDGKGKKLLLMYITPILVGLKIVDISLYNDFVNGKNSKPLMDIYKESDLEDWLCSGLLNRDEAFEEIEGKTLVTVEQKLQSLYEAIFVTEYTNGVYHTMIGDYEFDSNSKHFVRSIESMLSVYADYEL
ncbi:hypothetical protein DW721_14855 [Clostridium sp. AM27-31LB]|jgi:hypothetical protein|uniref:KAP family P-loop NTPase fold protein n=1 Tax=Clostridia TaxID=186801 RepID=UPI000E501FF6|nr:P-loop NTPase fold protein [Clostridium sp. AM27-31LB]RHT90165.1 hypothetical protein DW721_14855 [Clostridium sp. AM27-31LB]